MNMENKKKNIKGLIRFICFSLVFVLLFAGLSNVFVPKEKNDATGMSANITDAYLGEENNTIDIVFIGNSDVYRAINPIQIWEKTGITSCDVGMPRMNVYDAYRRLDRVFTKQQPKLVVLEADCIFSTSNAFDENGRLTANDKRMNTVSEKLNQGMYNLKTQFKNLDDAILSGISYNFPLTKYKYRWKKIKPTDFFNRKGKYYYFAKGFIYDKHKVPFKHGDTYMCENAPVNESISDNTKQNLDKIYELCKRNNAEFMLLTVPSGNSWNINKHNAVYSYSKEKDIRFFDFNKDIQLVNGFDWQTDTKDGGNHLNCYGAEKVTDAVINVINQEYGFEKTALSKSTEERWNNDAQRYYREIVKRKS